MSAVFLKRKDPGALALVGGPQGQTLLNADQFEFNRRAGIDTSVIYQFDERTGIEGRYLWVDRFEDSSPLFNLPQGTTQILTNPPTDLSGRATNLQGLYDTGFQTAEINLRRDLCDSLTLLGGFRYAKLDETLTMIEPGAAPGTQTWDTRNKLYGFQLGLDGILYQNGRWRVNGILKGGLYGNVGTLSVDATEPGTQQYSFSRSSGDKTAFLGEAGLYSTYQLTHHWAIRGGWQLLWLTNVATAPDQVAATGNLFAAPGNIPSNIDMTGNALYQGLNLGLEFTY
ncbi:MAG: BBP7 family outer membrane beta-barrel protein [Planctomycetes bacterium]|nr:BBP7 family outer membrane beta-barrel protein [Planctomycetota bacterium]